MATSTTKMYGIWFIYVNLEVDTFLSRLIVGATVGTIRGLFAKVKAIDAKHGKFDLLLCAGDFFGPPKEETSSNDDEIGQLLDGQLEGV